MTVYVDTQTIEATDYCDRCGARAQVRVLLEAGELFLCRHHFNEHEKALTRHGTVAPSTGG